jgi:hypothetical protein
MIDPNQSISQTNSAQIYRRILIGNAEKPEK